jgi:hypothetical protein
MKRRLRLILVIPAMTVLWLAGMSLSAQQAGAQTKQRMSEQVFKNIQALKRIPVDDFMGTMGIMSAALGFDCSECHNGAGTDKVNWAADTGRKVIARKMVERTGHSGEHYIAHDRKEYWHMWAAAIGGGLLTVITAALKLRIYDAHVPLFVEGFAARAKQWRVGDGLAETSQMGPMANPFYHDLGLSKETVGAVRGSIGLVSSLLGIAAGGLSAVRSSARFDPASTASCS